MSEAGDQAVLYYSQLDWHHPDYFPRGRTGLTAGRAESGEWFKYIDYMDGQLKELLTNYGPIGGIWFDGMWDKPKADWRIEQTYKLIHSLQPAALVGSNHHLKPFAGEDFQMFEKDLPGHNTAGFNAESEVGELPLETCETINGAWGFNANDKRFKSAKDLIHYLVKAAGYNANFLLNVGPMPNGKIQPEFVDRLKQVGAWLEKERRDDLRHARRPAHPATLGSDDAQGQQGLPARPELARPGAGDAEDAEESQISDTLQRRRQAGFLRARKIRILHQKSARVCGRVRHDCRCRTG